MPAIKRYIAGRLIPGGSRETQPANSAGKSVLVMSKGLQDKTQTGSTAAATVLHTYRQDGCGTRGIELVCSK